jgi:AbrB family transcriptional regulator (stage V sporulation protein T)
MICWLGEEEAHQQNIYNILNQVGNVGNMPVTKVDEKGRVLLPKELRKRMGIKPGEEFLITDVDADAVILKRIDVKKMLESIIEKAKGVDFDKLEKEIGEEGNRVARKKYKVFD